MIDQTLYRIPRIFVQGDRDPSGPAYDAAVRLGKAIKQTRCWGVSLGAYGGFVKALEESGVDCLCHETEIPDHGNVKFKTAPSIDAAPLADVVIAELGGGVFEKSKRLIAWGNRLGVWASTSQAYCFFAGNEGTLAHLFPVLAFIAKRKKGTQAKRVALIGWEPQKVYSIVLLFGFSVETNWFQTFSLDDVEAAVEFLTATT